jgi:hypothetical protein
MADTYWDLLTKSQRVAMGLAGDALKTLQRTVVAGAAGPDELARELGVLLEAAGGLASATAQPLQDFVVRQRELADTMASLATAQAELAGLVATLAQRHAEAVAALEKLTAPAFGLMGTLSPDAAKKGAKKPR